MKLNFFNQVSFLDKMLFTKHLSVMIKSGIPISEAISTIADQSPNPAFKRVLKKIGEEIANGQSLERSLSFFPKVFDPFFVSLVKVGEQSGNLEGNLLYLADHLKKDYEFRQKIVAASIYPAIVMLTVVIVGGGISIFVLPQLVNLFKSLDTQLPLTTRILLWVSETMRDYGILIFAGLFVLFLIFRLLLLNPKIRFRWDKFLLGLPLVGLFIKNVEMTNFSRNIGVMLKSGLPLTSSLETQKNATSNLVFKNYLVKLLREVETGKSIQEVLSEKRFKFVPKIATKMIGVGEETGKLDEVMLYLGDFFEDEVDNTTKNLSNVLEPILLLVIGMIVTFVALAIISPIYEFTGSVKR